MLKKILLGEFDFNGLSKNEWLIPLLRIAYFDPDSLDNCTILSFT